MNRRIQLYIFTAVMGCGLIRGQTGSVPDPLNGGAASSDYRLSIGDTVKVGIYLQPDLATTVRIDSSGNIRLPLVDNLGVSDLTIAQAQKAIEFAYRDGEFLRHPHATIQVEQHVVREVMITGEVRAPGSYTLPVDRTLTVLDIIVQAGGLTEVARGNAVVVTRIASNGEKSSTTIAAANLLRGDGDKQAAELVLRSGDIVFVPERIF